MSTPALAQLEGHIYAHPHAKLVTYTDGRRRTLRATARIVARLKTAGLSPINRPRIVFGAIELGALKAEARK